MVADKKNKALAVGAYRRGVGRMRNDQTYQACQDEEDNQFVYNGQGSEGCFQRFDFWFDDLENVHEEWDATLTVSNFYSLVNLLVPGAGIQPARGFPQGILSPSCLAVPPPRLLEATAGVAPAYGGFADRSVSYFTTWPTCNIIVYSFGL